MSVPATIFELKEQAQRLAQGLADANVTIGHSQVSDLVAKMHGQTNWGALLEVLSSRCSKQSRIGATRGAGAFLNILEWTLRCQGFGEDDFDVLVDELVAPCDSERINDDGLTCQLQTLLQVGGSELKLLELLQQRLPGFNFEAAAILARVMVPGTSTVVQFDALPFFLNATPDACLELLDALKGGTADASEGPGATVVRWSAVNGRDVSLGRNDTHRLQCLIEPQPGIAPRLVLAINRDRIRRFLGLYLAQSPEALRPLMQGGEEDAVPDGADLDDFGA